MADYPTEEQLQAIGSWPLKDPMGWLDAIAEWWWGFDASLIRYTQRRVYLSTGGWSGNEELIAAMQGSFLWFIGFESSRRGGHFVLNLTRLREFA